MAHEVDFFLVGDSTKAGDATCLRYNSGNGQVVMIIDAGNRDTGLKMSNHIKEYYFSDVVDFAFLTHPHDDHMQGLFSILENLKVKKLVVKIPWKYSTELCRILEDGRRTPKSVDSALKKSISSLDNLIKLAESKRYTSH